MTLQQVTPMIHVPDVRATVAWYESIGFAVLNTFEDDDGISFALLSYGNSQIMLTPGGRLTTEDRHRDAFDPWSFSGCGRPILNEFRIGLQPTYTDARTTMRSHILQSCICASVPLVPSVLNSEGSLRPARSLVRN